MNACSGGQRYEAMRWCEMAMRLLKQIGSAKSHYERQVSHFTLASVPSVRLSVCHFKH